MRAYLTLIRVSLAPSAVVDALVGLSIGTAGAGPGWRIALLACAASLCAFAGGMALNDYADRAEDQTTRPDRPLPSGAITPGAALRFGVFALALAVGLASVFDLWAGLALASVAVCAAAYDLFPRGPWSGPTLLGLCRAGNLSFGVLAGWAAGVAAPDGAHFLPAIGYGLYVFCLSRLSAFEDGARAIDSQGIGPKRYLQAAGWVLLFLPLTGLAWRPAPLEIAYWCAALLAGIPALLLLQHARRVQEWTPAMVGRSMGMGLRRLMIATGSVACMTWHGEPFAYAATAAAGVGMALAYRLRSIFPPS